MISYRLYYQLTGLYDDTEIEQYCNPFLLSWKHEAPCSFAVVRLNFGSFGIFECIKYNGSGNPLRFKDGKLELVECLKVLSDSWKLLKELSSLVQKYQETGSLKELNKNLTPFIDNQISKGKSELIFSPGSIRVRFGEEGMSNQNIRDLIERIERNIKAIDCLRCSYKHPVWLSVQCVSTKGSDAELCPRKFPFKTH